MSEQTTCNYCTWKALQERYSRLGLKLVDSKIEGFQTGKKIVDAKGKDFQAWWFGFVGDKCEC